MSDSKLKAGDKVLIQAGHPWQHSVGELIAFETFGLGWKAWRVRLEYPAEQECYAKPDELQRLK